MNRHLAMSLMMVPLLSLGFAACERQNSPPKPIGAATNKHVEESPASSTRSGTDAMIQQMKAPMDKARQTEEVLKGAAERSRQQSDPTTP